MTATTLKNRVWKLQLSKYLRKSKAKQPHVKLQIKNVAFQMVYENAIILRKMTWRRSKKEIQKAWHLCLDKTFACGYLVLRIDNK